MHLYENSVHHSWTKWIQLIWFATNGREQNPFHISAATDFDFVRNVLIVVAVNTIYAELPVRLWVSKKNNCTGTLFNSANDGSKTNGNLIKQQSMWNRKNSKNEPTKDITCTEMKKEKYLHKNKHLQRNDNETKQNKYAADMKEKMYTHTKNVQLTIE